MQPYSRICKPIDFFISPIKQIVALQFLFYINLSYSQNKNRQNQYNEPKEYLSLSHQYLLSLLAALGFSGCSNNNVWDEPCYYGPGPDWTPDVKLTTQVQNEDEDTINGIRVVASYKNQNDSLITDTAYTESHEIDNYTVSGIATSTLKFKEYPPKNSEIYLEYTDVDGEKNGAYQQKTIKMQELGQDRKVTLIKEEKKEEEETKE